MSVAKKMISLLIALPLALISTQAVTAGEVQEKIPVAQIASEGVVLATPDLALMSFTILTEAPKAPLAAAENARKAEAFLSAVKKFLREGETIKSTGYQVMPLATPGEKGKKPAITGYRVSSSFQVKVREVARLGDLIDLGVQQGINEISGPAWQHSQIEALTQEATVLALQKAKEMAAALAASQGLKVKRLQKVSTATRMAPLPRAGARFKDMAVAMEAPATPIEVGEQEIRALVEAVFELE